MEMGIIPRFLILFSLPFSNFAQIPEIIHGLDKVTDFALNYYEEINFDGLLGFVIAEAQIAQTLQTIHWDLRYNLEKILIKLETIRLKIIPILPKTPPKMPILKKYLLRPQNWMINTSFTQNSLRNLGIYKNWKAEDILRNKKASYKGVPSDYCLMEILQQNCYVSPFCHEMMFAPRIDTGYLLSHRLFYLQIIRLKQCKYNLQEFHSFTSEFCSLMLKEIRTSDYLAFPAHDIVLEQIVLCGIEGYPEFLNKKWRNEIIKWQNPFGCFKSEGEEITNFKRSSNVIEYGCTDHSTGLGAATLAVNLKFILNNKTNS